MNRRALDFRSFDEIKTDLDRLQAKGYGRGGTWSLAQVCKHLSIFVQGSLEGFTAPKPPWLIRLIGPWLIRRIIRKRQMPVGVKVPRAYLPDAVATDAEEVDDLKRLLARFQNHRGPLHPSPLGGDLSYEDWRELHFVHCGHYLSFLHPADKAST